MDLGVLADRQAMARSAAVVVAGRPAGREGLVAGHPDMVELFARAIESMGGDKELYTSSQ